MDMSSNANLIPAGTPGEYFGNALGMPHPFVTTRDFDPASGAAFIAIRFDATEKVGAVRFASCDFLVAS